MRDQQPTNLRCISQVSEVESPSEIFPGTVQKQKNLYLHYLSHVWTHTANDDPQFDMLAAQFVLCISLRQLARPLVMMLGNRRIRTREGEAEMSEGT